MDYRTVHLAINLADRVAINPERVAGNPAGNIAACESGGSTWCYSPSDKCGTTNCVGTSTKLESIESMVSLPADRFEAFQKEFQALLGKFAAR